MAKGGWHGLAAIVLAAAVACSPASQAHAQSLREALAGVLADHKRIEAAEADVLAARNAAIASLGGWFPTLDVTVDAGREKQRKPRAVDTDLWFQNYDLSLTQLLWDFGATNAAVRSAKRAYDQAKANLDATIQSVLLEGITAHLNLIRAAELVRFARMSEDNIKRQTELEDARVQRGSGFSTDVLQAKTQLAGAQARRVQAEGALENARNRYRAVFYREPADLQSLIKPRPPVELLPPTLDETIEVALETNPQVEAQLLAAEIARETVNQTRASEFFPTLNVVGESRYKENAEGTPGFKGEHLAKVQLSYSLNLGLTSVNTLRAAKGTFAATEDRYVDTRVQIEELVRNAWQNFLTARENAEFLRNQANIAGEFLELARRERQLGRRSLIDVLTGETALINSNSEAVSAETDVALAVFNLLSVMGALDLAAIE